MVRVWYTKMLVRIARGDAESKYRRIELLYQALENYFKLRGLWYSGAKAALPWLARHDRRRMQRSSALSRRTRR